MNENDLIQKLNKLKDIQPKNKTFFENLKIKLINQRISQTTKTTKIDRYISILKPALVFGSMSFLATIMIFLLFFTNSPYRSNNFSNSSDELINENQNADIYIDSEKVITTNYTLKGLWINLKLPADWIFVNPDYDIDAAEYPEFHDSNKILLLLPDSKALEPTQSEIFNNYIYKNNSISEVDKNFLVNSKLKNNLYNKNYIALPDLKVTIVFSTESNDDIKYLNAILDNLTTVDPYKGWYDYQDKELKVAFKYPASWDVEKKDETKIITVKKSIDDKDYTFIKEYKLNIQQRPKNHSDSKYDIESINGMQIMTTLDENSNKLYIFNFDDYEISVSEELLSESDCDSTNVAQCQIDCTLDDNIMTNIKNDFLWEIKLILSSFCKYEVSY